jgi:hypothetical protein
MKKQDPWTESVLSSLDDMQRAALPAALHERLLQQVPSAGRPRIVMLRRPALWLMAASLALLISLNIYTMIEHEGRKKSSAAVSGNPIANEYFVAPPSI